MAATASISVEPARESFEATEGAITFDDLERVQSEWTEPLGTDVFGLTGWMVPPNSQGYLTLASAAVFERLGPPDDPEDPGPGTWPSRPTAPWRSIATTWWPTPPSSRNSPSPAIGRARGRASRPGRPRSGRRFAAPPPGPGGTAYLAVIDAEGLAVSFIQSNFMGMGSGLGAGEAGFFLHNRGAGFDLRPGHPNELAPGKRPLHTLSPSLWTRGRPDRVSARHSGGRLPATAPVAGGGEMPEGRHRAIGGSGKAALDGRSDRRRQSCCCRRGPHPSTNHR